MKIIFLNNYFEFFLSNMIVQPWIRIQIGLKSWIRIQIQCIWIHNTGFYTCCSFTPHFYTSIAEGKPPSCIADVHLISSEGGVAVEPPSPYSGRTKRSGRLMRFNLNFFFFSCFYGENLISKKANSLRLKISMNSYSYMQILIISL